ncbi:hypothetical protein GCM10023169_15830 [Georgenia halophila]|uniref:Cell division protein FtsB n=1 Tax=Georgenia halophila TaxID=620889 RepID=A0ABP8L5Q3_9MICO
MTSRPSTPRRAGARTTASRTRAARQTSTHTRPPAGGAKTTGRKKTSRVAGTAERRPTATAGSDTGSNKDRSARSGKRIGREEAGRRALTFGTPHGGPRPTVSLRALALFIVVLVAFAVVAPTLRYAVAQQEELRELNADVAEAEQRTAELRDQLERWQDPAYVKAQARDRLGYVMPGERPYVVVDPETVTGGQNEAEARAAEREAERAAATPWYVQTWQSVQVAGESVVGEEDPSGLTVPTEEQTP